MSIYIHGKKLKMRMLVSPIEKKLIRYQIPLYLSSRCYLNQYIVSIIPLNMEIRAVITLVSILFITICSVSFSVHVEMTESILIFLHFM